MSVFLLIDEYNDHYYDFVAEQIPFPLIIVRPSRQYKRKQIAWIDGCLKVLKVTNKNDIIICTLDIQAVVCSWICALLHIKRRIVCVNILLKDKNTIKNKFVSFLYKKTIMRKNVIASVTSPEYGNWLNKKLATNIDFTLLHDVYHDYYEKDFHGDSSNSIFCGGRNGRDWNFILRVAQSLPSVKFNLVVSKGVKENFQEPISPNVNVYSHVDYEKFYQLMCESKIICLPLNTEAPAGLLVIFHGAANKKMVITTETKVTREYIGSDRGVAIKNDEKLWHDNILYFLRHDNIREQRASNLLSFLKKNCSEEQYVKGIEYMVSRIQKG